MISLFFPNICKCMQYFFFSLKRKLWSKTKNTFWEVMHYFYINTV